MDFPLPRSTNWQPSDPPRWLVRRPQQGQPMPDGTIPHSSLTPDEWMNIMWITTRVMSFLGHPPVIMAFEAEGTPEIVWADPEEDYVVCVLDYKIRVDPPHDIKLCLHISEHLAEGVTLGLIGLCTMRDALWDMIPITEETESEEEEEEEEDAEEDDERKLD